MDVDPDVSSAPDRRRLGFLLSPRWIAFHLLVVGAVVLMANLGFWQLRRLDERRAENAEYVERIEQPPVPIDQLLDGDTGPGPDTGNVANRRVTAEGTYLTDQIVLFNRSQQGRAVDEVLTPLLLDDGRLLVVNRGAIEVSATPPPPPSGDVRLVGRVRPSEVRGSGGLTDADTEVVTEVRRVDLERIGTRFDRPLVPAYVELIEVEPTVGPDDPRPLVPPELTEGNHLSYAGQWFIFAICVAAGWVFAVRRSIRSRRGGPGGGAVTTDGSHRRVRAGSHAPTDDASPTTTTRRDAPSRH